MSDLRTAALRALEALEYYRSGEDYQPTPSSEAITSLKAALAEPVQEPVQEPVAWQVSADFIKWRGVPLCATPPQHPAEPQELDNGGKTGWPPGLLQDDCRGLSKWLASRPDARQRLREALAEPQEPDPWGAGYEAGYAAGVAECPAERPEPGPWSAGFEAGYAAGMAERPTERLDKETT